jgi:hypothetical protein|tara:strand:- start:5605 stop:5967 length:363 start_codon:yes stop_codon:yes gene_type:complete
MKPLPSDSKILREIYNRYYEDFSAYNTANEKSRVHISIDIHEIAKTLRVEPEIVFGRLYYYLNEKYGYQNSNNTHVHLFALKVGEDRHAVNFPLLGSILASMREEQSKFICNRSFRDVIS